MDDDKLKRTYYIPTNTIRNLNNFIATYCTDSSGSTYGAASNVVTNAIDTYITSYTINIECNPDTNINWITTPKTEEDDDK